MRKKLSRREFTAIAASGAATAVAGCSGEGSDDTPAGNQTDETEIQTTEAEQTTETETTETETTETETTETETTQEESPTDEEPSPQEDGETSPQEQPVPDVPDDASVSLDVPEPAEFELSTPFHAFFEAENWTVEPAGEVTEGAGHFHLLIDTDPVETGAEIPSDEQHRHFGDGSEHAIVALDPGEYELTLQMGDGQHRALPLTDSQTVEVGGESTITIDEPADGSTYTTDDEIAFDVSGDGVQFQEAGELAQNAGHLHLLVDEDPVETGDVIPDDDTHLHFGDGTRTPEVAASEIGAGEHTLTMQVGNGAHDAVPVTASVDVTVEEP